MTNVTLPTPDSDLYQLPTDEIKAWITDKLNTDALASGIQLNQQLLNAIFKYLPFLPNYKEEGNEFSFSIVLGLGKELLFDARKNTIQTLNYTSGEDIQIQCEAILKNLIVLCRRGCDIFVIQSSSTSIQFGIYYTDIEKTGLTLSSVLSTNMMLFEANGRTSICLRYYNCLRFLFFDFLPHNASVTFTCIPNDLNDPGDTVKRIWNGIFDRVKKEVHGTIVLFVKPDWNYEEDKALPAEKVFLGINKVDDLSIPISINTNNDFSNELKANTTTLISMMDYDGVTIIDTRSRVLAYHNFCSQISQNQNSTGGARHNAFEFLINADTTKNPDFVAVYFQSQEGEIKFFKFGDRSSSQGFDPSIMEIPNIAMPAPVQSPTVDPYEFKLYEAVQDLKEAHFGPQNFYTEPEPAAALLELINNDSNAILRNNSNLSADLISICLKCYLGNGYGVSIKAQPIISEIFIKLDPQVWTDYLSNSFTIDIDLMRMLMNRSNYNRFRDLVPTLLQASVSVPQFVIDYTNDDYQSLVFADYARRLED